MSCDLVSFNLIYIIYDDFDDFIVIILNYFGNIEEYHRRFVWLLFYLLSVKMLFFF